MGRKPLVERRGARSTPDTPPAYGARPLRRVARGRAGGVRGVVVDVTTALGARCRGRPQGPGPGPWKSSPPFNVMNGLGPKSGGLLLG